MCVVSASSRRKLGMMWNALPDSGSGLILRLSGLEKNGLRFCFRRLSEEKLRFVNSFPESSFFSRGVKFNLEELAGNGSGNGEW